MGKQDHIQYLEANLILKPDRFTSVESFRYFAKLVHRTAKALDVGYGTDVSDGRSPSIREITFGDTPDMRLYRHAFILRRRMIRRRLPCGRSGNHLQVPSSGLRTGCGDVRPNIDGNYRIKFKAEALPLKDQLGGFRILYSHACVFGLSQVHDADKTSMATLSRMFRR